MRIHLLALIYLGAAPCLMFPCLGCSTETPRPSTDKHDPAKVERKSDRNKTKLKLEWDAQSGRGSVVHRAPKGLFKTCFHCGYPKYTGGLVIGNYNGSGFGFYPKKPIRGHREINIFCAQDESIFDLDEQREYTYGWSENYGRGDDGIPLKYINGKVLSNRADKIALMSINGAGCYKVTKVAYTRADVQWWIIATRIENKCDHLLRFDFFSGDDPWLGQYRSSAGDVGWTPKEIVRNETFLKTGQFAAGGIYDLGNRAAGETEGRFSNQANFTQIDPTVPLPDKTFFANSFAHRESDIDLQRPLDNKTLTALNLGWTDRHLEPGGQFTVAMALGMAVTGKPGTIPSMPPIGDADWSFWRRYLRGKNLASKPKVLFAAESVSLKIGSRNAMVQGTYWLHNTGSGSAAIGINYPIIISNDNPAPKKIFVNGRSIPVTKSSKTRAEGRFSIQVPEYGIKRFEVRYLQKHRGNRFDYLVTSANSWPEPLTRALFWVRYPKSFGKVSLTYPIQSTTRGLGYEEHLVVEQPFRPTRELEVRFQTPDPI